jgi:hypothetical protein
MQNEGFTFARRGNSLLERQQLLLLQSALQGKICGGAIDLYKR